MLRTFALLIVLFLGGCSTGLREPEFHAKPLHAPRPHRTVILFLVDGLAVHTLETGLASHAVPNLSRYFLRGGNKFAFGEASFPTLTYPNIASILTTQGVGDQPVISNKVLAPNGKVIAYEDPAEFPRLRKTIDPVSVIGTLDKEGRETASFSYVFGMNATDHMSVSLIEGIEYVEHDYKKLDARLLSNLEHFLRERGDPANWPDFLYVHLVGVDGTSHQFGPDSKQTRAYLSWLDRRMERTLGLLERGSARPGADVVSILTADHGFVPTRHVLPYAKLVRKADLGTVVINEGRFLALHQAGKHPPADLRPLLRKLREKPGVEITALRDGDVLELSKGRQTFRFVIGAPVCEGSAVSLALPLAGTTTVPASGYHCPTDFDDVKAAYPFLVDGLSRYLSAPNHPDAVVIAAPTASFSGGMRGSHGGPTAAETFVPVLLRNAALDGTAPVRTTELLKLLVPARL
jgi:hypothetical protein